MFELIDVIIENRSLQFLNLSYNTIHDPLQAKYAESTPHQMGKTMKERKALEIKTRAAKTAA